MEGRIQKLCLASTRKKARVEHTFMAPEYGSTFRKDAITLFPRSSVLISNQGT